MTTRLKPKKRTAELLEAAITGSTKALIAVDL